jgi:hypothetical protein
MKQALKQVIRSTVHGTLGPMEGRLLRRHSVPVHPPVFIVGAPRSGTSLFYELLVTCYRLAYFSNLAHRFYKTPSAVTKLGRRPIMEHRASYESDYGHIDGWGAPNEGGWIWQRWLADCDWQDETALDPSAAAEMRATLAAQEAILNAPFVNKNVMHANRIRLLDAIFPGCLFIELRRDMTDTARSIIRAQQRHKGPAPDAQAWWSVRPSNARAADQITRAALQVRGVAADIARDADRIGKDRLHGLDYADLCRDTHTTLDGVAAFLRRHGLPVAEKGSVPTRFDLLPSRPLDPAQETSLREALRDA